MQFLCLHTPVIQRCESSESFSHGSIFVLYSIEDNVMFKYGEGMIHMYWVYLCYMCCNWLYAEFLKFYCEERAKNMKKGI